MIVGVRDRVLMFAHSFLVSACVAGAATATRKCNAIVNNVAVAVAVIVDAIAVLISSPRAPLSLFAASE